MAGSSTIFFGYFFSSTNSKAIFCGTKTTNFYKNRSFWPQIQFFPRSFWVQFSAASGPPPPPPPGPIDYLSLSLQYMGLYVFNWPISTFQFRWLKGYIYSSCYYHHQIGSINLTHCYHIFRGCVPEMFIAPYSVTYCIYIPGKPWVCFHYYCAVYDDLLDMFCLADRIRLFVHNSISLSSLCKLFWRQWTDKMPVRYILSRVWVRLIVRELTGVPVQPHPLSGDPQESY